MPITLLTSPPPALSQSELLEISSSTPSTFEGIPPLLRHKEEGASWTIEPAFKEYTAGTGTLYVTDEAVSFFNTNTSKGISIPYPNITLHAISRAPLRTGESGQGGPCIYCQVDEVEGAEDEEGDSSREVIIVPSDPSTLDKIFENLSNCAALHPPPSDPNDSSSAGGGGAAGGFFGLDPASAVFSSDFDPSILQGLSNGHGNSINGINGGEAGEFEDGEESTSNRIPQMTEEEEANLESAVGRAAREHMDSIITWPAGSPQEAEQIRRRQQNDSSTQSQ